jgi:hypothetical protein
MDNPKKRRFSDSACTNSSTSWATESTFSPRGEAPLGNVQPKLNLMPSSTAPTGPNLMPSSTAPAGPNLMPRSTVPTAPHYMPGGVAPKVPTLLPNSSSSSGVNISITSCLGCHGLGSTAPVVVNHGTISKSTPGDAHTCSKPGETLYFSTVQGATRTCTGHGQYERY